MALIFEQYYASGIAQLSYLIGASGSRSAAVVDPRPDVDIYLDSARKHGLSITHIVETHIHADFMSGSRTLAARLGATAKIYGSAKGDYHFDIEKLAAGDRIEVGGAVLTARHTPGHTPEHIALEIADKGKHDEPWAVLTGDALFVGSAGRPDLLGSAHTDALMEQLYHTLREYFLKLDDDVIVLPGHGAGSACGASIGDRPMTTIGRERRTNPFLQPKSLEEFRRMAMKDAPPVPAHYPKLKKVNAQRPAIVGASGGGDDDRSTGAQLLSLKDFLMAMARTGTVLFDVRHPIAFGGGHIDGAINIEAQPMLSVWAGEMFDHEQEVLLVLESDAQLHEVTAMLARTGFVTIAGALAGGISTWANSGRELTTMPALSIHELREMMQRGGCVQVLDVRTEREWSKGAIPGAVHKYAAELRTDDSPSSLDRDACTAVYCGSGFRASIAASLLKKRGFTDIHAVPGSFGAWTAAKYPVVKPQEEQAEVASA